MAALEIQGVSLELDGVLIRDAIKWNLDQVADEVLCISEAAGEPDPEKVRALARRLDSLADLYERGSA